MNPEKSDPRQETDFDPVLSLQNRLRLTAIVAASVSLLGLLVLLATLLLLFRERPADGYYQIILSLTQNQERLGIAMTIAGSLIVLLAGLVTWLITLYSSHRVAGPLYRFSKNLELEIEQGPVAPVRLRRDDGFQALSNKFARAADCLEHYYADQMQLIDELSRRLDAADTDGIGRVSDSLRELTGKVTGLR